MALRPSMNVVQHDAVVKHPQMVLPVVASATDGDVSTSVHYRSPEQPASTDDTISPATSTLSGYMSDLDSPLFEGLDGFDESCWGTPALSAEEAQLQLFSPVQTSTTDATAPIDPTATPLLDPYMTGSSFSTMEFDNSPQPPAPMDGDLLFPALDHLHQALLQHQQNPTVTTTNQSTQAMVTIPAADLALLLAAVQSRLPIPTTVIPPSALTTPPTPTPSPSLHPPSPTTTTTQRRRPRPTKTHPCTYPTCTSTFTRAWNLRVHLQTHNPARPRPYTCPHAECGATFVRMPDLVRHEGSAHAGRAEDGGSRREHVCGVCGRGFARRDAWRRHCGGVECGRSVDDGGGGSAGRGGRGRKRKDVM
ncbi:hypothetical protein HDV00_004980 [Rhizophlyctis rosea]|nr:hypothetical protein HDV00_004980 [Rhizophlyctis rosea]